MTVSEMLGLEEVQALLARVQGDLAIACPAFPTNKRTI